MRADQRFQNLDKQFWANVRTISQQRGYTDRKTGQIKTYSTVEMVVAMEQMGLNTEHLIQAGISTNLGQALEAYFAYRAEVLNTYVQPRLMDVNRAREVFEQLKQQYNPTHSIPKNKQKGEKKTEAYLTGIVNILIEANSKGVQFDSDPRILTTVTKNNQPFRTLSRRVDGCFPSCVNPVAVWEIKEYYHTTTFGSRVADGVYESLLDGLELAEIEATAGVKIEHLLIVDARYTWWDLGRSYLCRLIDMLNMGYVDEILFGYEVVERLPGIVQRWLLR